MRRNAPSRRQGRVVVWLILAVTVAALLVGRQFLAPSLGQRLVDFEVTPLNDVASSQHFESLEGKVTLLHFWSTQCGPCRMELPHLIEVYKELADDPQVQFVAVTCSMSGADHVEQLRADTAAVFENRTEWPAYADPSGAARTAVDGAIGFSGYPTTLVLDRQARVRQVWLGYEPGATDEMLVAVRRLVREE